MPPALLLKERITKRDAGIIMIFSELLQNGRSIHKFQPKNVPLETKITSRAIQPRLEVRLNPRKDNSLRGL